MSQKTGTFAVLVVVIEVSKMANNACRVISTKQSEKNDQIQDYNKIVTIKCSFYVFIATSIGILAHRWPVSYITSDKSDKLNCESFKKTYQNFYSSQYVAIYKSENF